MKGGRAFKRMLTSVLHELGARDSGGWYALRLETRAGPLELQPYDTWLACQFADVDRARQVLGTDPRLNPYSGKWNWHPDRADASAIGAIRRGIASVLPVESTGCG